MPNEIKPVIVADDGINRSIKPVIVADDGINPLKKKEVSQSTQKNGVISSEPSKTEKQKHSESLSSVRRWSNVTEPSVTPSKYKTDDYIDILENKPLKKKKVVSVKADEYAPKVKVEELDVPTYKEAETMMEEDFGRKEFDAYQNINKIDKNIVFKTEDQAVKELREKFKGSGFIFETTGAGNKIKISTSTNGGLTTINSKEFELVPSALYGQSQTGMPVAGSEDLSRMSNDKYNEIVDFMSRSILKKTDKDFLKKDVKDYGQLVNLMADNPYKYGEEFLNQYDTDRWFDNQYKDLVIESKSLKRDEEDLLMQYDEFVKNPSSPEKEAEIKNKINSIEERKNILKSKYDDLGKLNDKLKVSSAVYYKNKEKQGNTLGLISKSFIKGAFNMEKALTGIAADVMPYVLPEGSIMPDVQREKLKASGMSETEIKDYASKQLRQKIVPQIEKGLTDLVSFGTTDEYLQSKDRGDLEKVASFLSESIGTAISAGGNPTLQKIAFFTQSYNGIEDEMNSSQFDGLNQFEKKLLAVPYGLTIGALENLGFKFTTGATKNPLFNKLVNNIVFRTFSNLPKDASATLMQNELKRNTAAMIANAGLRIVGGALVEGAVEGAQQLDEIAIKNISNAVTDKDYFKDVPDITTAKGINQAIGAAATDAYYGALGGLIMSAGSESISAIRDGYSNRKSDDDFAIFSNSLKDNNLRSSIESDIKAKIVSGDITKEEAKAQIESMNKSYSILQSIPDNLNLRDQRDSFNLILEKQKIQKEIEGKDPALVAAQTNRINEINNELKTISENAVQKQTTGEIPLQPETRVGGEMEEGKPQTEPEIVTEEGQEEQVTAQINIAPLFDTKVTNVQEAESIRQSDLYQNYKKDMTDTAQRFGIQVDNIDDTIGGYEGTSEVSTVVNVTGDWNNIVEFAAIYGAIAPEVQDSTIAGRIVDPQTTEHNADRFDIGITNQEAALKAAEDAGFSQDGFTMSGDKIMFFNIFEYPVSNFDEKYATFVDKYIEYGGEITSESKSAVQSEFIDSNRRAEIIEQIEGNAIQQGRWEGVRDVIQKAKERNKIYTERKVGVTPKQNLVTEKNVEELRSQQTTPTAQKIFTAAKLAMKALPGVKVYIHNNTSEFDKGIGEKSNEGDRGAYFDGEIHINLENGADVVTLLHEAMHHALVTKGIDSGVMLDLAKGLKSVISDKALQQRLEIFISQYNASEQAEEYLAELGGIMAEAQKELTTTKFQKFKNLINKLAKKLGLPVIFSESANAKNAVDFMNSLTKAIRTGENILSDGIQSKIQPTQKIKKQVKVRDNYNLSFVKKSDIIDINSLIKDISSKDQNVWFWVADQLGRGFVDDDIIDGKHYLDAGPSFALDPENRKRNIIWASGATRKAIENKINSSDYIFIISGSPQKSKLFNKTVSDLVRKRIEKNVDFNTFKKSLLDAKASKNISSILDKYDNFDDLFNGSNRKEFLIAIDDQKNKNTKTKQLLESYNAFIDYNSLRDDFYSDNGFEMGDIMLVLKPTKVGEKSDHSTYENNILGEVVGVPDAIINSYDILPEDIRSKYKEDLLRVQQQQIVAPYGMGVKKIKKQKGAISPDTSSNYANLTEDDKGNFVFFHRGENNYDVIKRSSGATLRTSASEGAAIGRVGGVAMYYTRPTDSEKMVTGQSTYVVKIPKDSVYDFNSDPLNFIEEAEKRFKEDYPGLAFSPNDEFAYITKIADENGYGMTVGQWGERTRAQTVQEYTPFDVQTTDGNRVIKPFEEEYISNTDKGFVSVIPESKNKKLNDLYNKIYKARNAEGRYDDLYRIQEESGKMTEDQITDMIMNSDLSQEIKDEYQSIINAPIEQRRSIKKQKASAQREAIQKAKDKYVLSVEERGNPHQQGVDAALNDLRKSDWYNTANDTQRENAERELKEFFGEKIKKAPSAAKVLGKPKAKKVAIKDEYKAMITQIKMEAKAARQAKADLNTKRKMLASSISGMVKTGKIKASQSAILIKRVSNLNLDNPVMVERFTNYAERVFERADYQQRLDDAFAIRRSIRKLLKTDNQAEVSGMAKSFTKIDPSLVDDIDAYIEIADKVKNAVKPSRVKGLDVVMKESANIAEISEYTKDEIDRQEDIQKKELLAIYDFLESEMSLKEMQDVINALKDPTSQMDTTEKEKYVKDYLNGRFGIMSSILESMFKTGIDPMTGEEITFNDKQKDLIKRALKIDLNEMSVRDAIKIVESVENFITNQITSGLEAAVSSYEGAMNVNSLVNKGKRAKSLRLFFSNYVGKIYSEQLFSLPMLMEKMFGGVTNSIDVMSKMGLGKLINGVNKANKQHNEIIDEYSKQPFYARKNALGRYVMNKGFMDAENVYERGMIAFLKRNLTGSQAEMKAEFERRVRMIQESINKLNEDGDPKEQKMGELYQKIYDKLGVAEMDMDVINANASKNNLDAVNWWINQWSSHYSDLSDISLSVYNTQLGSDLNYTPDKYKKLSSENQSLDEGAVERNGAFAITIDYIDKSKTGVLMETTRPNVMPDGRYISLDFDTNNSKALKSALTDINTASAIRQIDGFINSKSFKKLIPESEDRTILTKRINTYIRRAKGKSIVASDTIQYVNKLTNYITSLGVGKALGGISQAVSQTIPVMVNTVVNSGRFDIAGADFNAWLNKTGLPISNRGLESQSTVESIDRKIDTTGTLTQEALKAVADLNQWYLKQFLVRPDIFVARSSFKSYYLQNLKRRGLSTDIDWTTHEMDLEAAEYAQAMIDRQQNISDSLLAGEFLASDDPIKQITRKVVLPFASFILNQKARMYNDLNTITSKTATNEDKIIARRSLAGLAAELATFQLIGFGIRRLYDIIAAELVGDDDDEETRKKKMLNATKYPVKSIVNDIVSPLPITDGLVTWGLNESLKLYPWMNDKEIKDAVKSRNKVLELKGDPAMTQSEEEEFIAKIKEEATYQVFEDDFDRSFGMIGIAGTTYQELAEISKLSTAGEFTDEYQGRETTKKLLETDRKKVGYAVPFLIAYSTGLLPKDIGTISRNYVNRIKKKAVTEKQYDRYESVQKDLGRNLKSWEIELVKGKKESETAISEIKFIERNGGLTERQGREYLKLMKAIGEPSVSDLTRIKNGQTANQILK
jgi:hypothetical protein